MSTLTFYFDFISPYAWLASREVGALAARHGLELEWKPVLFAGLLNHWGQLGPAEIEPKRHFTYRDIVRKSARAGAMLVGPPSHPFSPLAALRLSLESVAGERQEALIRALFDGCWERGRNLEDPETLALIASSVGIDVERAAASIQSREVKDELKRATADAIELGVFGVPTIAIAGELYWGYDQFDLIDAVLNGEIVIADEAEHAFLSVRPSAQRQR